jgi:hypothetical protein
MQDDTAQYDSGVLHLRVDLQGPKVKMVFDPAQPQEGSDVTLSVTTEAGLQSVTLRLGEQNLTLTEGQPGNYQVLFQAPTRGTLDFTLTAVDAANNATDVTGKLTVTGPTIPAVQNVRAQPLAGGIFLEWDEMQDPTITGYQIEAKSPGQDTPIKLNTGEPVGSAEVRGLKSGIDYYVTVRALRGTETGAPSTAISARTLGIEMTVTPQEGGLLLQWTFPDTTPLATFTLEYGTVEGEYSETRTLDGAMRAYALGDLLAQPYLIRLTPVAVTGKILTELTVETQGTPLKSTGFHASAGEFPGSTDTVAPGNGLHSGAPSVPGSGLPGIPLRIVLGLTVFGAGSLD